VRGHRHGCVGARIYAQQAGSRGAPQGAVGSKGEPIYLRICAATRAEVVARARDAGLGSNGAGR